MNDALLSSKNMCWCTPPDFFAELDREFHFELDPASTDKSAKCARATKKAGSPALPWLCSFLRELTRHIFTTGSSARPAR